MLTAPSRATLRKELKTKHISVIGEEEIKQIKSYRANKLSKLTDMQIDAIKNHSVTASYNSEAESNNEEENNDTGAMFSDNYDARYMIMI
ncbi:7380_t:CDS:2 [Paraglomus occultum]|uniref:7380_t:CDS:1 n=1 Tax=Paraglomus occultum TaxID=144539 RepID=A0A9N9CD97_9GLOM|nr:7380_t:CDS:2 [Paraglomus occultum]